MFDYWGGLEWFFVIWVGFYFITFLIIISKDKDIDNWLGESIVCMFLWPLILLCLYCSWCVETNAKQNEK